jgi:glycosyltransferase involved in cell wall biosynthesis
VLADRTLSILLVSPESTGGIGRHVRMLSDGLLARGQQVTVCAPQTTIERLELQSTAAGAVALPIGTGREWVALRRSLRALAAEHDVTHAHGVRAGAQLALAGAAPLVTTWHNAPLGSAAHRATHRLLERICARRSGLVLGASADLVERARTAGAERALLCEVAAPLPAVAPGPGGDAGLHDPPVVLAVGRLHRQKRFDLLVDAIAGWSGPAGRPQVLIAGDGPLAEPLARQATAAAAPVRFLGVREDVDTLLAGADVVVLSSDWEARPLIAQEALRAGVPLIATDVGGVRDLVGEAAVLVRPGDADALRRALRTVLTDDALRRRLRELGPRQAATWPTVDEMVNFILDCYLDLSSTMRPT